MDTLFGSSSATWLTGAACSLDDFRQLVEQKPDRSLYPHCAAIENRVPVYDARDVVANLDSPAALRELMGEWNAIFDGGPGVVAFKRAFPDTAIVDEVTAVLQSIIGAEAAANPARATISGRRAPIPGSGTRTKNWAAPILTPLSATTRTRSSRW